MLQVTCHAREDQDTVDEQAGEDVRGHLAAERARPQRHEPLEQVHGRLELDLAQVRVQRGAEDADLAGCETQIVRYRCRLQATNYGAGH